jgi:outer membrane protein TolC
MKLNNRLNSLGLWPPLLFALAFLSLVSTALGDETSATLEQIERLRTKPLTEEGILALFRKQSVSAKAASAKAAATDLEAKLQTEAYQPRLSSQLNWRRSNERPLNPFQPVQNPYEDWNLGVAKRLPVGLNLGASVFGTQYSFRDGSANDATELGAKVRADFDLLKNFLGRLDRTQLTIAGTKEFRAGLEEKLQNKQAELQIRKGFWSFVSLERSLVLAKELIKSAERQLNDALARSRAGAADPGEVARYQAQLASRNSSLLIFQYEREQVLKAIAQEIPDFRISEWKMNETSTNGKQEAVQSCISKISQQKAPDPSYSNLTQIIGAWEKQKEAEINLSQSHGGPDLQLTAQHQITGSGNSYTLARSRATEEKRSATALGLTLTLPFGGADTRSRKSLERARADGIEAELSRLKNSIAAQHESMMTAMALLALGLKNQEANSSSLDLSYREMQRKYRQGRVPVSTLVLEQDSLFQSRLREIDLRKQITHLVLDYFLVFDNFPCLWNQI